jgi:hypothetical protein
MCDYMFEGRYDFTFVGHHYTRDDRAGDQRKCPHCGFGYYDFSVPMEGDANFKVVGFKMLEDSGYACCYMCNHCLEMLYMHVSDFTMEMFIKTNLQYMKYVDKIRRIWLDWIHDMPFEMFDKLEPEG